MVLEKTVDRLKRGLGLLDANLVQPSFDTLEKRLSLFVLVSSLFSVVAFALMTNGVLNTLPPVAQLNRTLQYFSILEYEALGSPAEGKYPFKDDGIFGLKEESIEFLALYGGDPNAPEWQDPDANWMAATSLSLQRNVALAQAGLLVELLCFVALYFGLSSASPERSALVLWYRLVLLFFYLGIVFFILSVYRLATTIDDFAFVYLAPDAALAAHVIYVFGRVAIFTTLFVSLLGSFMANLRVDIFNHRQNREDGEHNKVAPAIAGTA